MKIDGTPYRSVWVDPADGWSIRIFDQTRLPWAVDVLRLTTWEEAAHAIRSMQVRGAPLPPYLTRPSDQASAAPPLSVPAVAEPTP